MGQGSEDSERPSVSAYVVAAKQQWGIRSITGRGELNGARNEVPLIIYLFGATGAGKTVLEQLYAREQGISYDAAALAKKAGIDINLDQLREALHLSPTEGIHVLSIPKFTTRDARPTEINGIDFYFLTPDEFQSLRQDGRLAFAYQYPKGGAWYGMPNSISWPSRSGRDSLTTMTGYDAYNKMATTFPDAVGIWVDANPRDIEAHIKGRAASEPERKSRLSSFTQDRSEFYEHRHKITYSVMIESLKALRTDVTSDRLGMLLREMDDPLRQMKSIMRWEGYLRKQGLDLGDNPQIKFDYFLNHAVGLLFNGIEYAELDDRVSKQPVTLFDQKADDELLDSYTQERGISRALLDNIVSSMSVNAVLEANGRRTIVLSPYPTDYITAVGGTGKRVVLELLAKKLNGIGAHLIQDDAHYTNQSLLSLVNSPFYHLDEGLYVTLSSDHVPVRELERPRSLNFLFSDAPSDKARSSINPINLEETVTLSARIARDDTIRQIFRKATQP